MLKRVRRHRNFDEAVLESVRREIHREATLALVVDEARYRAFWGNDRNGQEYE